MKRHLNLRPYECNICKAKFARTSTLKLHLHIHKNDLEKKDEVNVIEKYDPIVHTDTNEDNISKYYNNQVNNPFCNIINQYTDNYNTLMMMNYLNMLKASNYHINGYISNNFNLNNNIFSQQQLLQYILHNNQSI